MTVTLSPQIVFTKFESDGDGVLLNLATKQYFTLNETAAFIWAKLEAGMGVDKLSETLHHEFAVSPEEARLSVDRLIAELENEGLVQIS